MYGLTDEAKLRQILKISTDLGITANDFGENTKISTMGAHNILTGKSKNPRTKNLNVMLEYLQKVQLNTEKRIKEPLIQRLEEPKSTYSTNLEDIIFDKMYEKMKPEIDDLKKQINNLEIEINKLKK